VLALLNEEPTAAWPPDMDRVYRRLQERFGELRAKGEVRQTPTYSWHKNWEGSESEDGHGFVTPDLQAVLRAYHAAERQAILAGIPFRPVALAGAAADPAALDFEANGVPPRVLPRAARRPAPAASKEPEDFDRALATWQESGRGLVVLGDPGHGKSWLVARLAWGLLARLAGRLGSRPAVADVLPLRVTCRELSQEFLRTPAATLPEAVAEIASQRLANAPGDRFRAKLRQFVEEQFRRDAVFLLADGWDELAAGPDDLLRERRAVLREQLGRWIAGVRRSRLLLTSRPVNYAGNVLPEAPEWELQPLNTEGGVLELVRKWLGPRKDRVGAVQEAFDRHPQLREAARVPLFGALICWLSQDPSEQLPAHRTELLNTCLRVLLRRASRGAATDAVATAVLNALAGLAYRTFRGGRWVISEEVLQEALTHGEPLPLSAADVQQLLTGEFGLFTRAGVGDLEIVHQLFADLLCARGVVQAINRPRANFAAWLKRHGGLRFLDPRWHEVWCHLAALLKEQDPRLGKELVAAMWIMHRRSRSAWRTWAGAPMDDLFGTALCLAGRCLAAAQGPWDTWPGKQIVNTLVADWIAYIPPWPGADYREDVTKVVELEDALVAIGRAGHVQPLIRGGVDYRIEEGIVVDDDLTRLLKRINSAALEAAREAREHTFRPGRLGLRFLWENMRWSVFFYISFALAFFVSPVLLRFIARNLWLRLMLEYGLWWPLLLWCGLFLGMLLLSKVARYQMVQDVFDKTPWLKIDDFGAYSSDELLARVIPAPSEKADDARGREAEARWFARPPLTYRLRAAGNLLRFRDPDRRIPWRRRLKAVWALLRLNRHVRLLFAEALMGIGNREYGQLAIFRNGDYCFFDASSGPLALPVPWPLGGWWRRFLRLPLRLLLHVLLTLGVVNLRE
jgi:hypothetical protein